MIKAILAGFMIVPAVYVFSGEEGLKSGGAGLMFVTLPKVFDAMPNEMGIKAVTVLEINEKHPISDKLKELYPDRVIEPIYAREILLGGGNIHCITQQVPAAK